MGARRWHTQRARAIVQIDAKRLALRLAVASGCLVYSGLASAENELSEVVVTATRLQQAESEVPASISVIAGDAVRTARQQLALDESLAAVPGVFFQNRYNFAQDLRIAIRGFGARSNFGVRGIKIVVDGIPETLADGQGQVDGIDLSSIRQVEVLRGPASALYGNASGGVINIDYEHSDDPFVQARVAVGEYGYGNQQFKAGGSVGPVIYNIGVSRLDIDGYRDHSEAENTQISGRFRVQVDETSDLAISLSSTDQPTSNDPGGVTATDAQQMPKAARDRNVLFNAGEALDQQKMGLRYRRSLTMGGELTARSYILSRDFSNRLPFVGGGIVQFERRFAGGGLSYEHAADIGGIAHRLLVGIDYDSQRDDRQRYDNNEGMRGTLALDQVERVRSTGVFLQDSITLSERWTATVGLRYDGIDFDVDDAFLSDGQNSGSRRLTDWSPAVGVVFKANESNTFFGNVSTAFETPTTTEFANPDGSGGFNQSLQPQKSTGAEIGLRGEFGQRSGYEIAFFNIEVDDELIPFEIASSPGRDFYANVGKSQRRGLELALSTEPVDGLTIALAYTLSNFEFDEFLDDSGNDFSGNVIPGIPESFAHLDIAYRHESGFFVAVDALYTDKLYANNANTATIDGATVANLRAGLTRRIARFEIEPFLGVINLTNTDFTANTRINAFGGRYFEAGPTRNAYAGVSLRYNYSE